MSVSVIRGETNQIVASMPVRLSPFGVATNPRTSQAYFTVQATDSLAVFGDN